MVELRVMALAVLLAFVSVAIAPQKATAAIVGNDTITSLSLSGSPFAQDFAPLPTAVTVKVVLARRARVTVQIRALDGTLVKTLASRVKRRAGTRTWSWAGLNSANGVAADGIYRVVVSATNALGTATATRELRKGLPEIFPANPAAIVIVVDPGHGGRFLGACNHRHCEKTYNLDISLKLRALLERAGVTVVMTRTTDSAVNVANADVNGDGLTNGYDDLMARNDIANRARGDLNIHNHNNGTKCGCDYGSEIFTNFHQPWTAQNSDLADLLAEEQIRALEQFESPTFPTSNRGVKNGDYYYMAPYAVGCPTAAGAHPDCYPPWLPRPTMTPSVLTEALFLQTPSDFAMLLRDDVRLALAAGYYLGIASYVNSRPLGIGYDLVSGPPLTVAAASPVSYRIRVTNRGNQPSSSWSLQLHSVPAVPMYDGSGQLGTMVGSVAVPDGLRPGASVDLTVGGAAPASAGNWLIKSDVQLPGGAYASSAGIVSLQTPLTTTSASHP